MTNKNKDSIRTENSSEQDSAQKSFNAKLQLKIVQHLNKNGHPIKAVIDAFAHWFTLKYKEFVENDQ